MEKFPKEKIIEVANEIFESCDVVAKHGTWFHKAMSIMETGLDYDKTTMAGQVSKDPIKLVSYGWKEVPAGEAANVILALPKTFIKKLNGMNDEQYKEWLAKFLNRGPDAEILLYAASEKHNTGIIEYKGVTLQGTESCHLPREFVKGSFFFCDNKTYFDFIKNPEEALEHLTYVENEYFFDNLTPEEQDKFVEAFRGRGKQPAK